MWDVARVQDVVALERFAKTNVYEVSQREDYFEKRFRGKIPV